MASPSDPVARPTPPGDSDSLLEALIAQAPMGFTLLDRDLRYRRINDTLARINGLPAAAHLGRRVEEVLPSIGAAARAVAEEIVQTRRPVASREIRGETPAQPGVARVWREHWFPVFAADGAVEAFGVLVEEITAQRAVEQQREQLIAALRTSEEALQQVNRRKDEFLATLAHELRNPLAPIRSAVEVLRLLEHDDPRVLRAAAIIDRQVTQMVRLVDDLLDVNRITRGVIALHREVIDIARVVHAAVETSRPLLEASRHELQLSLPFSTLLVHADAARLAQALANVLNNAARYTPPGGRIALTVGREEGRITIEIRDNGVGIPPDRLEEVFDMFARVAPPDAMAGLGIGLALVRRIVQMHDGDVRARSEGEGMGTLVELWLPLHVPATAEPIPRINAGMRVQTDETTLRILIVDDNVDSATSQATMLELKHHVVCVVHDAAAALDVAPVFEPDVALLDIGLPGMNGYDLAASLRADPALAHLVLVAQTGWGQPADRARALEAGFDAHLTKPVDWTALQRVLAGAIASRRLRG